MTGITLCYISAFLQSGQQQMLRVMRGRYCDFHGGGEDVDWDSIGQPCGDGM